MLEKLMFTTIAYESHFDGVVLIEAWRDANGCGWRASKGSEEQTGTCNSVQNGLRQAKKVYGFKWKERR